MTMPCSYRGFAPAPALAVQINVPPPPPPPAAGERGVSARAFAAGLLLALALWAGEAAAQTSVCRGGAHTGSNAISCTEAASSAANILVDPGSVNLDVSGHRVHGVDARHQGTGGIELNLRAGARIVARGGNAYAIYGTASASGNIVIRMTGGAASGRGAGGSVVVGQHSGTGSVTIGMSGSSTVTATGTGSAGLVGNSSGTGDITVRMTGGAVSTISSGLAANKNGIGAGNITVALSGRDSVVKTTGDSGHGLLANSPGGSGNVTVTMKDGLIETSGNGGRGISAYSGHQGGSAPTVSVVMEGGAVRTTGGAHLGLLHAYGIYAERSRGRGDVSVRMTGGSVETAQANANAIHVYKSGSSGEVSVEMTGGSIGTAGDGASGAYVLMADTGASTEGLSIDAAGAIAAEGLNARGILGRHTVLGSAAITTRAGAEIEAPFAVGMEGRLTNDASAAGRIAVTHGGAAEARDVGVLAWAARSSGHTMGSGATTANDAARTTPMIHVTSSGTVTVGAPVTEAFIRGRIAGADETLSALEQAVLAAITDNDSAALTTALAALPADDYDAAWKAEAQNLLRKRAAAPTGDGPLAHAAAEKILGMSRAGVRAMALSHTAIADHVRVGDALSTAERAALTAVLTSNSSGLETALTALTGAAYTTAWKNTVRQHALTYNAGDIHVDIAGGSIDAEGNGVEALYVVPHDSNGAIAVTVAAGARVTGGAKGIYVRGAGVTSGVRNQAVTVHGAAMGGTGAGVHMFGGGAVTVGAGGEVGATSGVAILGAGGGALTATVSGTVTGDIRVDGGGSLTANVMDGGVVTGTIRDPQASFTVGSGARIGRVLYASGGAVTVAGGGKLTGVEGTAIESAAGALTVTVRDEGRVEGDVESGGTLTATVEAGGVVTGTIHNPQASFTVSGSVGRVLYASGGTVTVAGGGKLTGVEGTAAESTAGALTVTVRDEGRVEGDVESGGTLSATVESGGAVTGTIHNPQASFTVSGSVGRVLYADGGTLTIAGGGKLTGVEGVAAESTMGALTVTVQDEGRVEGDIESGGSLAATVEAGGAVTGTIRNPAAMTVGGSVGRILYDNGGTVTVAGGGAVTGVDNDGTTEAIRGDAGDLDVTVAANGAVTGLVEGRGDGNLEVDVAGAVTGDIAERGAGDLDVTVAGTVAGGVVGEGAGEHTVTVASSGAVAGTVRLPAGAALTISGDVGRVHYDNGGAVTVNASGEITGLDIDGTKEAIRGAAGNLAVTVHGTVTGNIEALGDGDLTVKVSETGTINGEIFGRGGGVHTIEIAEKARVLGTVHNPKSGTTVRGAAGRVLFDNGGALTVAATGRIAGIGGEAIRADAGDLTVSVASGGAVAGRIEGRGAGAMTVNVSGAVTGAIHGKGAGKHEVTVASGGVVTGDIVDLEVGDLVASVAGRMTGDIEERGAGDLTATVTGTVTGGIRGMGAGSHAVAVVAGGAVTGTVHLPTSAMTIAGRVGRVLYDNGGSVTVAATGSIAGVETEGGGREAIRGAAGDLTVDVAARATVTGDIRGEGDGDLDVDVSGKVEGGIFGLGGGEHDVHVKSGGSVEGLIHLAASTVTVDGSARSVLFDRGGAVAVGSAGRISGLDGRAVRSASGDLTVTVNGNVVGNIEDLGPGDLAVTVANALTGDVIGGGGGMHRLTVASGAEFKGNVRGVEFIAVAGDAEGMLHVPAGGTVEVAAGGKLVGAENAQGRRVAVMAETGALSMTVDGAVQGAVEARDAAAASTVTVGAGGEIDGRVALAGTGSTVEVNGAVQSVEVPRGAVTVGANGRIEEPVIGAVEVKAAPGESAKDAVQRVGGGRVGGGAAIVLKREGQPDMPLTVAADGRIEVGPTAPPPAIEDGPEPRHRVYEALPSVLLALNALPAHGDRFAAAGAPRGAFARLDAAGGERHPASSTAQAHHDYRRFGFEAGIEGAAGERGVFAISVHHVRGRADVDTDAEMDAAAGGGRVEVTGTGARLSGAWLPAENVYVSGQASATLYEADLDSDAALEGALARDLSGRGYAAGVEIGRRLDLGRVMLTPRAGADWSMVEMSSFTDSANERVSLDAGRRITARAGVRAESAALPGGAGAMFATLDLERELFGAMDVTAADRPFEAEAEATWARLGLGAAHEWADGRIALRANANYAAAPHGNRDFTGSATLTVRF